MAKDGEIVETVTDFILEAAWPGPTPAALLCIRGTAAHSHAGAEAAQR